MTEKANKTQNEDLANAFAIYAKPTTTVDFANYREFLEDMDMTDAQKEAFLQAMWAFVSSFAERGFGVHPVQQACGQNGENSDLDAKTAFNTLKSDETNMNVQPE
jgi:hypothetical protein